MKNRRNNSKLPMKIIVGSTYDSNGSKTANIYRDKNGKFSIFLNTTAYIGYTRTQILMLLDAKDMKFKGSFVNRIARFI